MENADFQPHRDRFNAHLVTSFVYGVVNYVEGCYETCGGCATDT
jgi:hypothetical protein